MQSVTCQFVAGFVKEQGPALLDAGDMYGCTPRQTRVLFVDCMKGIYILLSCHLWLPVRYELAGINLAGHRC